MNKKDLEKDLQLEFLYLISKELQKDLIFVHDRIKQILLSPEED